MTNTAVHSAMDMATLTAPARLVEQYLSAYIDSRPMPENLRQAVCYAVLAPGKRMRPVLVVHSCASVGGPLQQSLPAAAAIELIHAFSLVHDDLPAIDNDDLRRGRPTLHKHTSQAMAILAGDAMMSLAFDLILTQIPHTHLAASVAKELTAGTNDMIAGQVYDTLPEFDIDTKPVDRLKTIHRHKTGALIRAACRMGGLCGGANSQQLESLTAFGDSVGLMFQIVDDLLDVTQTTEHLGKTAGKDAHQEKLTYPAVLGIQISRRQVQQLQSAAHDALQPLDPDAQPLHDLCDYLAVRTK